MEGIQCPVGLGGEPREPLQLPEAESRRAAVGQGWQKPWGKAVSSCVIRA